MIHKALERGPAAAPVTKSSAPSAAPARSGQAAVPGQAAVASLTLPPGGGLEAAQAVMGAVDGLSVGPDGRVRTTYRGQVLALPPQQAEQVRASARDALARALGRSRRRGDDAIGRYRAQEQVNADFPVTSGAVKAWAYVRSLGDYANPGEAIRGLQVTVEQEGAEVTKAVEAGSLAAAAGHLARVDAASERMAKLVRAYVEQLIEGGESLATGLEYTRDAAFITLGILAVVVSGGAAAGVAPGVIGTGVAGLSVGGTATAISVGAPILANVGTGAVQTAYGDRVDWGSIAVDAAVQVVLARLGGKLGESLFGRLAGNPASQTLARKAIAALVSGVATHEVSQAFSVTVHQAYDALRGRDVTWGGFVDELGRRLSDPAGLFMAVVMSGVQLGAHVAVDRATAGKAPQPPAPKPAQPKPARPTAAKQPAPATTSKPVAPKPAPESVAAKPAPEPVAATPAPEPVAAKPAPEPVAATPVPEPVTAKPAPEPAAPASAPEPAAAKPAPEPAAAPAPKAVAAKPAPTAAERPAGRPAAAPPKRRPAPQGERVLQGPRGARPPGSTSRYKTGEAATELVRTSKSGASMAERALAEGNVRRSSEPGRTPGRSRQPAPPPSGPVKPISERVLVGDLENGLPTGVTGELHPQDLHTGTEAGSVDPVGLRRGELDPLGARRGHLLANVLGGSGTDRGNLAWMHKRINNSSYKTEFENHVIRALRSGQAVRFGVRPLFRPGEAAPYAVEVWATGGNGQAIVPVRTTLTPGLSDVPVPGE